jgi:hypothetical protein
MAKNNPPDGWDVVSGGTWSTDIDESTAVGNRIGGKVIHFKNTTPASNPDLTSDYIPIEGSAPYSIMTLVQADSIAAGNKVSLQVRWYDQTKSFVSTDTIFNDILPATGTWYELKSILVAPATSRFARVRITKINTAFNAYFDYAAIVRHPRCFHVTRSTNQTSFGPSNDLIEFDSETYDYGNMYDNATNYDFEAPSDGLYSFVAGAQLGSIDDGEGFAIKFYKNGSLWVPGVVCYASADTSIGYSSVTSGPLLLSRGDLITVYGSHTNASAQTIAGSGSYPITYFSGAELIAP